MPDSGSLLVRLAGEDLLAEADALYRFALSRVRDHDVAEDLVQETLLAAVRNPDGFEGRARLGTWLTGILRNKIIDHFRAAARDKRDPLSSLEAQASHDPDSEWFTSEGQWSSHPGLGLETLDAGPEGLVERAEVLVAIQECLARLPRSLQRIFALREFDDRDTDEICEAVGITKGSLGVLMHRSRQLLRTCLQRRWRMA